MHTKNNFVEINEFLQSRHFKSIKIRDIGNISNTIFNETCFEYKNNKQMIIIPSVMIN